MRKRIGALGAGVAASETSGANQGAETNTSKPMTLVNCITVFLRTGGLRVACVLFGFGSLSRQACRCHFDRREKSFLNPSHSLGMTGLSPPPWRLCAPSTEFILSEAEGLRTCFARVMIFPAPPIQNRKSKIQNQWMGRVKVKVEPFPTSLSTQILPPCSSTNFLAKVNPSPVPSLLCA